MMNPPIADTKQYTQKHETTDEVNGLGSIERALLAALFLGFFETTIAFTLGSQ
ncbi:MAG: hypothetical protein J7L38_02940 [Thermoproteales archaeon]|nr:hypothetical protein [Thermoproteales archaeon]